MRLPTLAARGVALAGVFVALASGADPTSAVQGRVRLGMPGVELSDVGPIVVYLEPVDGPSATPSAAGGRIRQRSARFSPGFHVVAAGQSVEMPNDDDIFHNVFSYSRGNQFDLGLYPAGTSRAVTLREPGVVKIYCSIHESMNGTIFVAPSPYFARVSGSGQFRLSGVPPGRYRLRTWCERLPDTAREVRVEPGRELEVDIVLAAAG